MFKTRLLSGIVLVILALFLIISGHEILLFATLAISCIGMFELYRVFKMEKTVLAGVGYLAAIVYYCNLQWKFLPDLMILFMAFLILLMFVFVFAYPKFHADQVMAAFFGFFYVAVMLSYVYQIRTLERGLYLAFLVFLCSWGCDTCAYCVGMLIGKHKMSPKLSPKKSVEGAGVSMDQVPRLMVVVVFSTVAIFLLNRHLEILQLGEAHARVLGIRITATRLGLILCALLLIAFATSVTGPIASVAFLAGPIAARISGSGKSNLMTSALTGCVLVMVSDLVGQYAFPSRYPVGVVTGILGAPYLIYLLIRMNRMEG